MIFAKQVLFSFQTHVRCSSSLHCLIFMTMIFHVLSLFRFKAMKKLLALIICFLASIICCKTSIKNSFVQCTINNNTMLAYRLVCGSRQPNYRIQVCILHQSDHSIGICLLQSVQSIVLHVNRVMKPCRVPQNIARNKNNIFSCKPLSKNCCCCSFGESCKRLASYTNLLLPLPCCRSDSILSFLPFEVLFVLHLVFGWYFPDIIKGLQYLSLWCN